MKKVSVLSIILLSFFSFAIKNVWAGTHVFNIDLKVGSTGSDVIALQSWLVENFYHIPSIESGKVAKGRFGAETKAAVQKFQKDNNLPRTGFVGPLTRGVLNKFGAVISTSQTSEDVIFKTVNSITTKGILGTLDVSLDSSPSGTSLNKGEEGIVAAFDATSNSSDMEVGSISIDFNTRLWLYAESLKIIDDSGTIIAEKDSLNFSDFTELTAGSKYRISLSGLKYIIPRETSVYMAVHIKMLSTSDRASALGEDGGLAITGFAIRATDGTGVTENSTPDETLSDFGSACFNAEACRIFNYIGGNVGEIISLLSPLSPPLSFIEISSSAPTGNALLGVYSLKSNGKPATLTKLTVGVGIIGNGNPDGVISNLFNSISLKVGDKIVGTGSIGTVTGTPGGYQNANVTFSDLSVALPLDQYIDFSVVGTIGPDVNNRFEGIFATTTLDMTNSANIVAQDLSYTNIPPRPTSLTSELQLFSESIVAIAGLPEVTYGSLSRNGATGFAVQQFKFSLPLMGGRNAIYIPKNVYLAFSTSTNPSGINITAVDFSDDDTSGDSPTYFYIGPNQIKTLTATYSASGNILNSGVIQMLVLNYGITPSASGSFASSPGISNILTAVLFH